MNDKWEIDEQISSITFEVPVFLATNVKGKFNEFKGFISVNNGLHKNYKAIFSVNIDSIDMNYLKYKALLMSEVFLDKENYPIALIETPKFLYKNQKKLILDVELRIKNMSKEIPVELEIIILSDDLIQIKGDMSLIGPRPLLIEYLPYYSNKEKIRHDVKPGITGLAQVNGRNNLEWDKRLKLDVIYVKNISFIMDLKIFFLNVKK